MPKDAPAPRSGGGRRRILAAAAALLVAGLVLAETWQLTWQAGLAQLSAEAQATARARALTLTAELGKQRAVATILAQDRDVVEGLAAPSVSRNDLMSRKFEDLRRATESSVIYAIDLTGVAAAASNWEEPESFRGEYYGFRDYVTEALETGEGHQYALGTVSNRPGLYLSHRVEAAGVPVGVVVVKVQFDEIEDIWRRQSAPTHVVDPLGTVVLSTRDDARFAPLPEPPRGAVVTELAVAGSEWRLVMYSGNAPLRQTATLSTVTAGLVLLVLGIALAALRQRQLRREARAEAERRYRADLERDVALRTRELSDEIQERKATQQRVAALQADLVQANKLAALGQITAGVAHEINQPLATIRLLAENGRSLLPGADAQGEVAGNLDAIMRMSDRIARITSELRNFSRKARGGAEPVLLKDTYEASVLLTASRRVQRDVRLIHPAIAPGLRVRAERVRLEQVLVNLLQNAHEAVAAVPRPEIRVTVQRRDGRAVISVADNGPGLAPEVAANLFTPFLTTKPEGLGLGLVISYEIARDFGGRLWADPPEAGRGATFHLELEIAA